MGFRIVPSDWRVPEIETGVGSGVQNSAFRQEGPRVQNSAFRLVGPRGRDMGRGLATDGHQRERKISSDRRVPELGTRVGG